MPVGGPANQYGPIESLQQENKSDSITLVEKHLACGNCLYLQLASGELRSRTYVMCHEQNIDKTLPKKLTEKILPEVIESPPKYQISKFTD